MDKRSGYTQVPDVATTSKGNERFDEFWYDFFAKLLAGFSDEQKKYLVESWKEDILPADDYVCVPVVDRGRQRYDGTAIDPSKAQSRQINFIRLVEAELRKAQNNEAIDGEQKLIVGLTGHGDKICYLYLLFRSKGEAQDTDTPRIRYFLGRYDKESGQIILSDQKNPKKNEVVKRLRDPSDEGKNIL